VFQHQIAIFKEDKDRARGHFLQVRSLLPLLQ